MAFSHMVLTPNDIRKIFDLYERWVAEGSLPYFTSYNARHGERQYFYDHNLEKINEVAPTEIGEKLYEFRVQVFDSPEWRVVESGTFRPSLYGGVTIRSHRSETFSKV